MPAMTGKIERQLHASRGKVERAQVETPTKTAAVSRNAAALDNRFSNGRPPVIDAGTSGHPLAGSARPDTLWGNSPAANHGPNMDPHQFNRMSPAQRTERLGELRANRDALQEQILQRVMELDKKWEGASTATKAEALQHYAENSDQLDPQARTEVNQMLAHAAMAQRRIDRLQSRRDGMPPSRNATAGDKRERAALNQELREARKEKSDAVKEATKVVDDTGLKVDRLAVTEQVIDPSAPKKEEGTSLLGMVTNFFKFTWLTRFMESMTDYNDMSSEKQVAERARARTAADNQWYLKKVDQKETFENLVDLHERAKGAR